MSTPPSAEPPEAVCEYCPVVASPPRHEDGGQIDRALGIQRRVHRAGQDDVVVQQFDRDVG